jgi:hypothetical protein
MNAPFVFFEDERSLSGRLGIDLPPLRHFDLGTFGINADQFLREFAPTFDRLSWDYYDVRLAQVKFLLAHFAAEENRLRSFLAGYYSGAKDLAEVGNLIHRLPAEARHAFEAICPYRQRSAASFEVTEGAAGMIRIVRVPLGAFAQGVGPADPRSMARIFDEAAVEVTAHPDFQHLLSSVVRLVGEVAAPRRARRLAFHQVRTVARRGASSAVVPEGIHQDGADYVVSALVVERDGMVGGESVVYGLDRTTPFLRTVLKPGQGLFHADSGSPLWHGVSPIAVDPKTGCLEGRRSIFGFDIHL